MGLSRTAMPLMALSTTDPPGTPSNDLERGVIGACQGIPFLSCLVWKTKIAKPLWGKITWYWDSSLTDFWFSKGWILLMTRAIMLGSDSSPPPWLFPQFLQESERKTPSYYILSASAKPHWGLASIPPWKAGHLTKHKKKMFLSD